MSDSSDMNDRFVLSIQLDKVLRERFAAFLKAMSSRAGREVKEAEVARLLLRKGLDANASMADSGYAEGWRRGMAEAKEAFGRGMSAAKKAEETAAQRQPG